MQSAVDALALADEVIEWFVSLPVLAQSRRAARLDECLLLAEQRTCSGNATTSVFDPGRVKTQKFEARRE